MNDYVTSHVAATSCVWGGRFVAGWGYRGGSPTAVRPSDPALCGSCPL